MFNMFIIYELNFQLEGAYVSAFKLLCLIYLEALLSTVYTLNLLSPSDGLLCHYNMVSFNSSNTVLNHISGIRNTTIIFFRLRVKPLDIFLFNLSVKVIFF